MLLQERCILRHTEKFRSRCNKEHYVLHVQSIHNYILPSSTAGIQLHVSALYVGHLQVVIQLTEQLYKMCGVFFEGAGGWVEGNEISLFQ